MDLVDLAIQLQGRRVGMTINDIKTRYEVSRRTAERMRRDVEEAFGPLSLVENRDRQNHWRLQDKTLRGLIQLEPEEFVELETAASSLEQAGLSERAVLLRELTTKLRAAHQVVDTATFEDDIELLLQAERLAMRPIPRVRIETGMMLAIRSAIKSSCKLTFEYVSRGSGRQSQQLVKPYGVIYGTRPYLVAESEERVSPQLWLLTNMSNVRNSEQSFEWNADFDLKEFAERSFGVYQEEPLDVVLRFDAEAAQGAENFVFHPSQKFNENDDGSLTVEFTAGGIVEICWHLVTWGTSVTVVQPSDLRDYLIDMCRQLVDHHSASES